MMCSSCSTWYSITVLGVVLVIDAVMIGVVPVIVGEVSLVGGVVQ